MITQDTIVNGTGDQDQPAPEPLRLTEDQLRAAQQNMETIFKAAQNGHIALIEASQVSDGKPVVVIAAVNRTLVNGTVVTQPVPLAVIIDGDMIQNLKPLPPRVQAPERRIILPS